MIRLLRVNNTVLAPADPAHRAELTALLARMEGIYGAGKDCGPDGKGECRDLQQLEEVVNRSRDPKALLAAWTGWHAVGRQIRPLYERFVVLGNEGARDNGFKDLGALWKSAYDMTPDEFEGETERIWAQVKPLYDDLHCYVRAGLQQDVRQGGGPGRQAHPGAPAREHVGPGVDQRLSAGGAVPGRVQPGRRPQTLAGAAAGTRSRMVKLGESFFTGSGSARCRPRSGRARCSPSRATARWSATPRPGT